MKASEILKLNSDFLLPPPAPCLSGRIGNPYGLCNLKPVDVTVCAVAVSFLSPLLCSALTVCQAHHPEPAALPEQQQQLPFFPCLCVPCSLPSSAQLCPPQAAASDSAPPNETRCPSCPNASRCTCCSPWEQLGGILAGPRLFRCHRDSLSAAEQLSSCHLDQPQRLWERHCWALLLCPQNPAGRGAPPALGHCCPAAAACANCWTAGRTEEDKDHSGQ